jgi:tetratricopeptide (TPR) repeat protein
MDTPMTLPEGKWTWVEFEPDGVEEMEDVSSFKTVEDWEGDATLALTRGDPFGALRIYEEILKVYPQYLKAWYNRAVILDQYVGNKEEALWCYDQALQVDPNNVDILHNKGKLLADMGALQEAEKQFIHALQVKPNYLKSLMALAAVYVNNGKMAEAERALALAERHKLTPQQKADLLAVKAIVLSNMGKSKQAIKVAKKALALNPKDDSLWETMGVAYFNIKKFRDAVRCLNKAIQMNPQNVSARQMKRDILDSLEDVGIIIYDDAPQF